MKAKEKTTGSEGSQKNPQTTLIPKEWVEFQLGYLLGVMFEILSLSAGRAKP